MSPEIPVKMKSDEKTGKRRWFKEVCISIAGGALIVFTATFLVLVYLNIPSIEVHRTDISFNSNSDIELSMILKTEFHPYLFSIDCTHLNLEMTANHEGKQTSLAKISPSNSVVFPSSDDSNPLRFTVDNINYSFLREEILRYMTSSDDSHLLIEGNVRGDVVIKPIKMTIPWEFKYPINKKISIYQNSHESTKVDKSSQTTYPHFDYNISLETAQISIKSMNQIVTSLMQKDITNLMGNVTLHIPKLVYQFKNDLSNIEPVAENVTNTIGYSVQSYPFNISLANMIFDSLLNVSCHQISSDFESTETCTLFDPLLASATSLFTTSKTTIYLFSDQRNFFTNLLGNHTVDMILMASDNFPLRRLIDENAVVSTVTGIITNFDFDKAIKYLGSLFAFQLTGGCYNIYFDNVYELSNCLAATRDSLNLMTLIQNLDSELGAFDTTISVNSEDGSIKYSTVGNTSDYHLNTHLFGSLTERFVNLKSSLMRSNEELFQLSSQTKWLSNDFNLSSSTSLTTNSGDNYAASWTASSPIKGSRRYILSRILVKKEMGGLGSFETPLALASSISWDGCLEEKDFDISLDHLIISSYNTDIFHLEGSFDVNLKHGEAQDISFQIGEISVDSGPSSAFNFYFKCDNTVQGTKAIQLYSDLNIVEVVVWNISLSTFLDGDQITLQLSETQRALLIKGTGSADIITLSNWRIAAADVTLTYSDSINAAGNFDIAVDIESLLSTKLYIKGDIYNRIPMNIVLQNLQVDSFLSWNLEDIDATLVNIRNSLVINDRVCSNSTFMLDIHGNQYLGYAREEVIDFIIASRGHVYGSSLSSFSAESTEISFGFGTFMSGRLTSFAFNSSQSVNGAKHINFNGYVDRFQFFQGQWESFHLKSDGEITSNDNDILSIRYRIFLDSILRSNISTTITLHDGKIDIKGRDYISNISMKTSGYRTGQGLPFLFLYFPHILVLRGQDQVQNIQVISDYYLSYQEGYIFLYIYDIDSEKAFAILTFAFDNFMEPSFYLEGFDLFVAILDEDWVDQTLRLRLSNSHSSLRFYNSFLGDMRYSISTRVIQFILNIGSEILHLFGVNSEIVLLQPDPTMQPTVLTKAPSRRPSVRPSSKPTSVPSTVRPSTAPTATPTTSSNTTTIYCPSYSASNTNYASYLPSISECSFIACAGASVAVTVCSSIASSALCSGDTYLKVYDSQGSLVAFNDDYCSLCSTVTFTASAKCQTYTIWEGCYASQSCSGKVGIVIGASLPTLFPTTIPSTVPTRVPTLSKVPSVLPSSAPSLSSSPTASPTTYLIDLRTSAKTWKSCPTYSASNTASATSNVKKCDFLVCNSSTIQISTCSSDTNLAGCSFDPYLRVYDESGNQVAANDDSCGQCSYIQFTSSAQCQRYSIWEGCYSTGSCSATVAVGAFSPSPTANPTYRPTALSTTAPTSDVIAVSKTWNSCPSFSSFGTGSATSKVAKCKITACSGYTIYATFCSSITSTAKCSGDTYLRLFDGSGNLVDFNDDYCGLCATIIYRIGSEFNGTCQDYTFWQGCFSQTTCSGQLSVLVTNTTLSSPSGSISSSPTFQPTFRVCDVDSSVLSESISTAPLFLLASETLTQLLQVIFCNDNEYLSRYGAYLFGGALHLGYSDSATSNSALIHYASIDLMVSSFNLTLEVLSNCLLNCRTTFSISFGPTEDLINSISANQEPDSKTIKITFDDYNNHLSITCKNVSLALSSVMHISDGYAKNIQVNYDWFSGLSVILSYGDKFSTVNISHSRLVSAGFTPSLETSLKFTGNRDFIISRTDFQVSSQVYGCDSVCLFLESFKNMSCQCTNITSLAHVTLYDSKPSGRIVVVHGEYDDSSVDISVDCDGIDLLIMYKVDLSLQSLQLRNLSSIIVIQSILTLDGALSLKHKSNISQSELSSVNLSSMHRSLLYCGHSFVDDCEDYYNIPIDMFQTQHGIFLTTITASAVDITLPANSRILNSDMHIVDGFWRSYDTEYQQSIVFDNVYLNASAGHPNSALIRFELSEMVEVNFKTRFMVVGATLIVNGGCIAQSSDVIVVGPYAAFNTESWNIVNSSSVIKSYLMTDEIIDGSATASGSGISSSGCNWANDPTYSTSLTCSTFGLLSASADTRKTLQSMFQIDSLNAEDIVDYIQPGSYNHANIVEYKLSTYPDWTCGLPGGIVHITTNRMLGENKFKIKVNGSDSCYSFDTCVFPSTGSYGRGAAGGIAFINVTDRVSESIRIIADIDASGGNGILSTRDVTIGGSKGGEGLVVISTPSKIDFMMSFTSDDDDYCCPATKGITIQLSNNKRPTHNVSWHISDWISQSAFSITFSDTVFDCSTGSLLLTPTNFILAVSGSLGISTQLDDDHYAVDGPMNNTFRVAIADSVMRSYNSSYTLSLTINAKSSSMVCSKNGNLNESSAVLTIIDVVKYEFYLSTNNVALISFASGVENCNTGDDVNPNDFTFSPQSNLLLSNWNKVSSSLFTFQVQLIEQSEQEDVTLYAKPNRICEKSSGKPIISVLKSATVSYFTPFQGSSKGGDRISIYLPYSLRDRLLSWVIVNKSEIIPDNFTSVTYTAYCLFSSEEQNNITTLASLNLENNIVTCSSGYADPYLPYNVEINRDVDLDLVWRVNQSTPSEGLVNSFILQEKFGIYTYLHNTLPSDLDLQLSNTIPYHGLEMVLNNTDPTMMIFLVLTKGSNESFGAVNDMHHYVDQCRYDNGSMLIRFKNGTNSIDAVAHFEILQWHYSYYVTAHDFNETLIESDPIWCDPIGVVDRSPLFQPYRAIVEHYGSGRRQLESGGFLARARVIIKKGISTAVNVIPYYGPVNKLCETINDAFENFDKPIVNVVANRTFKKKSFVKDAIADASIVAKAAKGDAKDWQGKIIDFVVDDVIDAAAACVSTISTAVMLFSSNVCFSAYILSEELFGCLCQSYLVSEQVSSKATCTIKRCSSSIYEASMNPNLYETNPHMGGYNKLAKKSPSKVDKEGNICQYDDNLLCGRGGKAACGGQSLATSELADYNNDYLTPVYSFDSFNQRSQSRVIFNTGFALSQEIDLSVTVVDRRYLLSMSKLLDLFEEKYHQVKPLLLDVMTISTKKLLGLISCCVLSDNCAAFKKGNECEDPPGNKNSNGGSSASQNKKNSRNSKKGGGKGTGSNIKKSTSSGDVHFLTLDGLLYDFHGYGEFILLRSPNVTIQARQRTYTGDCCLSSLRAGTQPTLTYGVAFSVPISPTAFVNVSVISSSPYPKVVVQVGSSTVFLRDGTNTSISAIFRIELTENVVTVTVAYSLTMKITQSSSNGFFNLDLTLTDEYEGEISGLYGTYSDSILDDFTLPDGRILITPPTTTEQIYDNFGLYWQVDASGSAFYYDSFAGESWESHVCPTFVPYSSGLTSILTTAEYNSISGTCGLLTTNANLFEQCMVEGGLMKDVIPDITQRLQSIQVIDAITTTQTSLISQPPVFVAPSTTSYIVQVGYNFSIYFHAVDPTGLYFLNYSASLLPTESYFNANNQTFYWNPTNVSHQNVIIKVTNGNESAAIGVDLIATIFYPSSSPSGQPSSSPTSSPSIVPSSQPSSFPTNPTSQPSSTPTGQPNRQPTSLPTISPSSRPSAQPSTSPTASPATRPTCEPSVVPSSKPTSQPSTPTSQPTSRPSIPTGQPTALPSSQPLCTPTSQPSQIPTMRPSSQPTRLPTSRPTGQPFSHPSGQPSSQPSIRPTQQPTTVPTSQPSCEPSGQPSTQPTTKPSSQPTSTPSSQPSVRPSTQPTNQPSSQPSIQPSCQPSRQPTSQPTYHPSGQPSVQPTNRPSSQPSRQPSCQPSRQPTSQPTSQPTTQPSIRPSDQPTSQPSIQPSYQPTSQPSLRPSVQPSTQPSRQPTVQPTRQPTRQPSGSPSYQPSSLPSSQPSAVPSMQPSIQPISHPTRQPSVVPSAQPSEVPSKQPSTQPSRNPTARPSTQPSNFPSSKPSTTPSCQPTVNPSSQPSRQPASRPSSQPSRHPSSGPSRQPSSQPSNQPTQPTSVPSGQPSSSPSAQPSSQPTNPTGQPTSNPSISTDQPLTDLTSKFSLNNVGTITSEEQAIMKTSIIQTLSTLMNIKSSYIQDVSITALTSTLTKLRFAAEALTQYVVSFRIVAPTTYLQEVLSTSYQNLYPSEPSDSSLSLSTIMKKVLSHNNGSTLITTLKSEIIETAKTSNISSSLLQKINDTSLGSIEVTEQDDVTTSHSSTSHGLKTVIIIIIVVVPVSLLLLILLYNRIIPRDWFSHEVDPSLSLDEFRGYNTKKVNAVEEPTPGVESFVALEEYGSSNEFRL